MGMHEGILAAGKPWLEVRAALEKHCGSLQDNGTIAPEQWLELPQGEDVFHVASRDGRTYLLDPAMVTAPTTGQKYLWPAETLPASGDLQAQIKAHHDRFERHTGGDWTKHIKPVPRAGGGFDLQYQPPSAKPSLLKRVFGK
jgi:hypothetical protein